MTDRDVVIVDGVRTPFAKAGSKLKEIHPSELGRVALKELLSRTNVDVKTIDEVVIGNVGNPSDAVNISRVVALRAGLPQSVSAHTVHRNCASAMESVANAYDKIKAGTADVVIAGGTESMSTYPLMMAGGHTRSFEQLAAARSPVQQLGAIGGLLRADLRQVYDLMTTGPMQATDYKPRIAVVEGLTDPFAGINMGQTAEILAKEWNLSREEQDKFALRSHQLAVAAQKSKRLAEEITPVFLPPKFKEYVADDIGPRAEQTMEQLAKLKPFFDRQYGTITVGNACPITDGAAMLLMMSRAKAKELGYQPKIVVRSYAFAGLEPERMGLGPIYASPKALKRAGLSMKDMGLVEINEAFAAQVLACVKASASAQFAKEKLGLDQAVGEISMDKLNVNGGAIALGHPVGATGSRLVLTLMREMLHRNVQFGLATLCIGGGQGGAVVLERVA